MWTLWIFLLFWANLEDIRAMENQNINEFRENQEITQLVEEQIQNYLKEVKQTLRLVSGQNKKKRSADFSVGRVYGAEVLTGFQELFIIPSKFPNDIHLFTTSKTDGKISWFAVALEADNENPQTSLANQLVLYNFDNAAWTKLYSVTVNGGVSLASLSIKDNIYIVVAEHYAGTSGQQIEGSNVYMFNETSYSLQYVQLLNTKYASHVIMWERSDMNEVFVAVATSQNNNSGEYRYSTQSIVYHWLGSHFDIVDYLPTNNPRSIVQYNIGSFMFLAVANYQDNYGNTNIDSEIFRYDLNSGKFSIYQRIRTNAAVDIKYFCFESPNAIESFLIVANHFEIDEDGIKNYETDSIIYKLSDEEYFIPFQSIKLYAVKKWIPIVHNMGETGAFVLLAVCENGVVAFQYDGWRFVKSNVQYSRSWFGDGISSIRAFHHANQTIFTLANKNNPGNGANIFNATFIHDSRMDVFYQDIEDWCEKTFTEVENSGIEKMVDIAEHAPKKDALEIILHSNLEFTDVELNSVKTDSWLTEDNNVVDYMTSKLSRINLELVKPQYDLEVVERTMESVFDSSKTIIDNVDIEKAVINCTNACNFSELNINTLNGEDMTDFIRNVIIDEKNLVFDELVEFKNVALLEPLETDAVNGHSIDSLIDWSQENYLKYGLIVNGSVTLQSELFLTGPIDRVIIDEKSILILNPDQLSLGSLKVPSVEIESLNLQGSLNGWNIGHNSTMQRKTHFINELNASELILKDRLLNGVDLGNLNLMALKTEAKEQIILGNHLYNRMEADDVVVSGMIYQPVLPGELQPDNRVVYSINGDSSVNPNDDYMLGKAATETIGVTVSSGRNAKNLVPDLLSTSIDHTEEPSSDSMSTSRDFLTDSLTVDSNVRESVPESIRSAAAELGIDLFSRDGVEYIEVIHEDYIFQGNLKINGTVIIVNGSLTAEDLISPKHKISSKVILEKGLRLDETNIPVHMTFDTPFNISKVNVETINNIKMESLVPTNASSKITITGHKTFTDGLKLGGNYELTGLVNNVNVSELVSNTLQCTGDQNITGSMLIGSLHTNKITSRTVYLNNTKWENTTVFKNGAIQLDFVSVEGDINVDALTAQGKVSDVDVEYMLQDTLFVDGESTTVTGFKNFTNHLSINKLETSSIQGLDMNVLTQAIDKKNVWNTSELVLDYPIKVEHLIYRGSLDGIHSSEFGEWLMTEGDQEVLGQQTVRSIQAIGGIVAKTINNVHVDRLLTETRRIDVNETMDHVIFNKNIESVGAVFVDGKVQGLDISKEAVLLESPQLQLITAHKTLLSPLIVNGSLQLKGNVAGFNLNDFCLRVMDNATKFTINNGSAIFEMEPLVSQSVNGYLLNELLENAWFINENVVLNYPLGFTHPQFFNTTLQGEINNIKLEELSTKYFSKTLNQTWEGDVHFPGGITVKNSLVTPSATVGNLVSGIKIEQFKESVLLDGEIQAIDGVLDFGNIEINGPFSTTGFVNDLDLLQDVMRLDVPVNFVKGDKLVSKVEVLELDLPPRGKIQNVDIVEWKKSAVNTSGNFVINGGKSFNGPFHSVSNMRVGGVVNGVPFDTTYIMHNSLQQTVTGRKVFDETSRVYVEDLELSGLLNGINMTDFFMRQVYTNSNVTINGSKTFSKALKANKVIFTDNDNLTKMELQLKTPLPYSGFNRQIKKLSSIAASVQESLQGNRIYLRNYSRHIDMEGTVLEAVPVKNVDHVTLLVVTRPYDVTRETLSFMKWDPTHNTFNKTGNKILYLNKHPTSLRSINMRDGQRGLIIESEIDSDKDKNDVVESFLFLSNYTLHHFHRFIVPSRSLILHFEDRQSKCYIIANIKTQHCQVYCYTARRKLHMRPPFECPNMTQSSVLTTRRATYVVTTQLNKTTTLHKWNYKTKRFNHLISLNLLNPVSVNTVRHENCHYIAIANQHLVGNRTAESVDIYRLNETSKDMVLIQQISIVAPIKVEFAILPSSELVLYVLSENRATPFLIFVYRGIAGFEHLYTEATLPLITSMASVTDEEKRHFVILTNKVKAMILQAHFS